MKKRRKSSTESFQAGGWVLGFFDIVHFRVRRPLSSLGGGGGGLTPKSGGVSPRRGAKKAPDIQALGCKTRQERGRPRYSQGIVAIAEKSLKFDGTLSFTLGQSPPRERAARGEPPIWKSSEEIARRTAFPDHDGERGGGGQKKKGDPFVTCQKNEIPAGEHSRRKKKEDAEGERRWRNWGGGDISSRRRLGKGGEGPDRGILRGKRVFRRGRENLPRRGRRARGTALQGEYHLTEM